MEEFAGVTSKRKDDLSNSTGRVQKTKNSAIYRTNGEKNGFEAEKSGRCAHYS